MPTDEWFKENPKVSAYISQDLNEKLLEWMKGRSIKKVSQALTAILEEYLGVVQTEPITQPVGDDRLEALEQKLESLSQTVQELRKPIQASSRRVVQTEPTEEILSLAEAISIIDTKQPIEVIEEIQDDEPDEVLYEFLEPETQAANPDTQKEAIETTKSEQVEESSLKVEESSPNTQSQTNSELKAVMSTKELASFLSWSEDKLNNRKRRRQTIEGNGISFIWEKEGGKIVWKPEPEKPIKLQEAPSQAVQ